MAFTRYSEVRPWAKAIQATVQARKMPPWHADPQHGRFANDARLKDAELASIVAWVRSGAPEGNPKDLPALPPTTQQWQIGTPDAIFQIEEYTLGSNGQDDQQSFLVKTNLPQDVWVQAVEIRPGNRKVVHHAVVAIDTPAPAKYPVQTSPVIDDGCANPSGTTLGTDGEALASFVPGMPATQYPPGTARRLPAGATLRFTIHYAATPGKEEKDRTQVGLRFATQPPVQPIHTMDLRNTSFRIQPNAENHVVKACQILSEDIELISYLPRMHYRGKSMRLEAQHPDGHTQVLLHIPQYDFQWQTTYVNQSRVRLPKGTRIALSATYDNSPNNRNNPDPSKMIRWGDSPSAELMSVWIEYISK